MYLGEQKPRYICISEHTRDADHINGGHYFGRVTRVFLLGLSTSLLRGSQVQELLTSPQTGLQ